MSRGFSTLLCRGFHGTSARDRDAGENVVTTISLRSIGLATHDHEVSKIAGQPPRRQSNVLANDSTVFVHVQVAWLVRCHYDRKIKQQCRFTTTHWHNGVKVYRIRDYEGLTGSKSPIQRV